MDRPHQSMPPNHAFLQDAAATVYRCPWWRHGSLQALPSHVADPCMIALSPWSHGEEDMGGLDASYCTWSMTRQLRLHACHGEEEIGNLGIMGKLPRLAWWCSSMMWCSIIAGCWLLCSVTFRIICRLDHLPGPLTQLICARARLPVPWSWPAVWSPSFAGKLIKFWQNL